MAQSVTSVSNAFTQQAASSSRSSRWDSDGASFTDALDRAQNAGQQSSPPADGAADTDGPRVHDQSNASQTAPKKTDPADHDDADAAPADSRVDSGSDETQTAHPDQGAVETHAATPAQASKPAKKARSKQDDGPRADPPPVVKTQQAAAVQLSPQESATEDTEQPQQLVKKAQPAGKEAGSTAKHSDAQAVAMQTIVPQTGASQQSTKAPSTDDTIEPAQETVAKATNTKPRLAVQPSDDGDAKATKAAGNQTAAAATVPNTSATSADGKPTTDTPAASDSVAPVASDSGSRSKALEDWAANVLPSNVPPPSGSHPAQSTTTTNTTTSSTLEVQFAQNNHQAIVTGIQGKLLPNGGSMSIRLDPPELGALNVHVSMRDGVMTASFETSNDQASKLLSHSLGDLKTALEAQGVSVEKLHVTQSSPRQQSSSGENSQRDAGSGQSPAQQEQQRREMLRRMWRRLTNGQDPLDLVA